MVSFGLVGGLLILKSNATKTYTLTKKSSLLTSLAVISSPLIIEVQKIFLRSCGKISILETVDFS